VSARPSCLQHASTVLPAAASVDKDKPQKLWDVIGALGKTNALWAAGPLVCGRAVLRPCVGG
jgi:hypothetical protein